MASAPNGSPSIRVVVRADRRLFRDALTAYLRAQPEFDVVGDVAHLDDLLALCRLRSPDVAVVDLGCGLGSCDNSLARLRGCTTKVRVVVVYDRLSTVEVTALLRHGVERFIPCTHGLDTLLTVLRRYLAEDRPAPHGGGPAHLTDREQQIMELVSAGHTVDRIAELLGAPASTVMNAKRRIYQKLSVASQTQAVARAVALGIVGGAANQTSSIQQANDGDPERAAELPELTPRECDILRSIADGHTVRQTARVLGIASKTVENTQARLFRKLGVRNRCGALMAAHAIGLLEQVACVAEPAEE